MVRVVQIDRRRRVAGQELNDVSYREVAIARRRESSVFLVESEIRDVVAGDRGEVRVGDGFAPGIHDHSILPPADDRREDSNSRLEPALDARMETIHQYI